MPFLMSAATALTIFAGALLPAVAADDPLARHRWRDRVILVLAPSEADPSLVAQRHLLAAMGRGARERDLVLVEAVDGTPDGQALRRRFGGTGFRAVLIGKDGGEKLTADHPLGADALFPLIDSMPMRQDEMKKAR